MRATGLADGDIPAYWRALGLPGLGDIHIHFLPQPMLERMWAYFDEGGRNYGLAWPVHYRLDEPERLALLRRFGVRAIPSLAYPHKPGMAQWLNDWCAEFARLVPDAVHCATLYPEDDVGDYVRAAVDGGARLFKMHVQVGVFRPYDVRLDPAGSGPKPGEFTGPPRSGRCWPAPAARPRHRPPGDERVPRVRQPGRNSPWRSIDTTMAGTATSSRARPCRRTTCRGCRPRRRLAVSGPLAQWCTADGLSLRPLGNRRLSRGTLPNL